MKNRFTKVFETTARYKVQARKAKKHSPTAQNRFNVMNTVEYFTGAGELLIFPNFDGDLSELEEGQEVRIENDGYPQTMQAPAGEYLMPDGTVLTIEKGKITKIDYLE